MRRRYDQRDSRAGSALATVLGLIAAICTLLAMMATIGMQRSFMARKLADRVRAQAYAEAGANEAYAKLASDWSVRTNAAGFPLTQIGQ